MSSCSSIAVVLRLEDVSEIAFLCDSAVSSSSLVELEDAEPLVSDQSELELSLEDEELLELQVSSPSSPPELELDSSEVLSELEPVDDVDDESNESFSSLDEELELVPDLSLIELSVCSDSDSSSVELEEPVRELTVRASL
jgi:hypothetical protein